MAASTRVVLACAIVALFAVGASAEVFFSDNFDDGAAWSDRWTLSKAKKDMGVWDLSAGEWSGDEKAQTGIRVTQDMKHHNIGAAIEKFSNEGSDLVIQFSVKHEKRDYSFCGGGYIKLMASGTDLEKFEGDTPYHIMFGPDFCGYDTSKIHAILNYDGKNLEKTDEVKLDYADKNEYTHLYTFHIKKDGTYEIFFDQTSKASGSITEDWDFPKKQIDDPDDTKPADWVDEKKIPDPEDVKPEGYDDTPKQIPDPEAEKPDDWSDEDDGEWEAPMIDNPEFKGEWTQKMIDHPDYKGEWKAAQIDNPDYKDDVHVYSDIGAVGYELWIVNSGSVFDNILVTDSLDHAIEVGKDVWKPHVDSEKDAKKEFDDAKKAAEEADKEDEADDEEDEDDEGEDADEEDEEEGHTEL